MAAGEPLNPEVIAIWERATGLKIHDGYGQTETVLLCGWSINSVWTFLSEKVRLLFFGVPPDAATLKQMLDPETFGGIVISDNAAVCANFTNSQKCWAHLLRKAIKLTLIEPNEEAYRHFPDRLLEIYREACRVKWDRRLSDTVREKKVAALDDEIFSLCAPMWSLELPVQGIPAVPVWFPLAGRPQFSETAQKEEADQAALDELFASLSRGEDPDSEWLLFSSAMAGNSAS